MAENQGFKKRDFAEKIGISRQTLDNWIAGTSVPGVDDLIVSAKILDVSPGVFIGLDEPERGRDSPLLVSDNQPKPIPLYDGVISAGYGFEVNNDPITGPTDMIYPGTWVKGANAAMRIHGDSMFPEYRPGALVALRMIYDYPTEIIWGEVYVVETQENRLIRAIHQSVLGEEYFDMLCLNPGTDKEGRMKYPVKTYPWNKIRRIFKVLGTFDYKAGAGGVFLMQQESENIPVVK